MPARILVVDDNRTNLDLMLYLLRAFGHEPVGMTDALSALTVAESEDYDLVLSDILMPKIDGYEFARRLRVQSKELQLIAVTALAMVGDRDRVLAAGFDGYISKPIDPQTFVLEVDSFLAKGRRSTLAPTHTRSTTQLSEESPAGPLVLIVDDVQVNLDVIRGALQPFGYRIVEARNSHEAMKRISEEQPEVILCDLHMSDGDGFDLIMKVKADGALRTIPFLFISSTSWQTADKLRGLELGAFKFLVRPIDPRKLIEEVERAVVR